MGTDADNTYMFDPEETSEMVRLIRHDQITTRAMGGPLPPDVDASRLQNVLDVACGPGGWVLDMAYAYPKVDIAGIDISQNMIRYASARAQSQGLNNASFGVMNVLQPLDFADNTFDMVNARFLVGVLHRDAWPQVMSEYVRITKPGGVIRLTESDGAGVTNSPAIERLSALGHPALDARGYGFSQDGRTFGITNKIERFLHDVKLEHIRSQAYAINHSAGAEAWSDWYHNNEITFKLIQPLIVKMNIATQEELDKLYQQALIEMTSPDLCAVWYFLSVWGTRP